MIVKSPTPEYDPPLTRCALCESDRIAAFDRDELRGHGIWRCRACGVLFMNPQYSDEYLRRFYSGYISVHGDELENPRYRTRRDIRAAGKRRSMELLRHCGARDRMLSVGSGDGTELAIAKELGFAVEGYDIDPVITTQVSRAMDVPVHSGRFENLALDPGSFDVVFLDQVLEHPKNPADYLRKIRALLEPGGLMYLGMPNIGSWSNRAKTLASRLRLRGAARGNHYSTQHHLFYYTPRVIRALLERRFGFRVERIRGSLKPQRNPVTPWVSRFLPNSDSSFLVIARKEGVIPAGGCA
ncbi:MAG: class I SAM-dependent methyltransferase [Planctomycetes bacterium]|nr:class I SAM-dependent methyltransferase [Planctomycetota bacterium]MCB9870652.1 class I SAM-dependent methyltransferase [Planctomycetota bacterium]